MFGMCFSCGVICHESVKCKSGKQAFVEYGPWLSVGHKPSWIEDLPENRPPARPENMEDQRKQCGGAKKWVRSNREVKYRSDHDN